MEGVEDWVVEGTEGAKGWGIEGWSAEGVESWCGW